MLMSIVSGLSSWWSKVQSIVGRELSHLSQQEYWIGLVFCISIGFVLMRARS